MLAPLRPALDRIARGFTTQQKVVLTVAAVIYVICPLDFDFLPLVGWVDDGVVLYLLKQLWAGPTLPQRNGRMSAFRKALEANVVAAITRVRKVLAEADGRGGRP